MQKEKITEDELMSQLRQKGLETADNVKSASIESGGRFSVILKERARTSGLMQTLIDNYVTA